MRLGDILLADFEQSSYGTWKVEGTAFGTGPAQGTLPNQMSVTGFLGHGLANSYVGGDESTGSLSSPSFRVERKFIDFLVGGGNRPGEACVNLLIDGKVVLSTTGKSTTPQDTEELKWASWNVGQWKGKDAQIQILDNATGRWGHINVDQIYESDEKKQDVPPKPEPLYHERYRPQFHFSSKTNWLNDPNGLVYDDGEYHLFFQHNPGGIQWGDMHWGHAVSRDLLHWNQLADGLSPDALGTNYSGSAVVDVHNTSGFGKNGVAPLVAIYTSAGKPFVQSIAYSLDKGRTFTKYPGNPIIPHIANENRDPKVFWHEESHKWVMALYLDGDEYALFGSPDLKSWHELSRLHLADCSECPELFEIKVEGTNEKKWIFYGGNFHYAIGHFDGTSFTAETKPIQGDFGANFYASQTYNQVPDGRRIQIGWMNGAGPMPGMPFNQQMSFPCELRLVQTPAGLVLTRTPVKELESLRGKKFEAADEDVSEKPLPITLKGGLYDIEATLKAAGSTKFRFKIGDQEIVFDPAAGTVTALGKTGALAFKDGHAEVRILVDRSSIEIYANGGLLSMTSYFVPQVKDVTVTVEGRVRVDSLAAYQVRVDLAVMAVSASVPVVERAAELTYSGLPGSRNRKPTLDGVGHGRHAAHV